MNSNLEKELSDILEKIHSALKRGGITLQEARDPYFEAKNKYLTANQEEKTQEARLCMLDIFFQVGKVSEKFVENWQNGKFKPYDKELNLLKEGCNEVLEAFDNHFREDLIVLYGKQRFSVHHAKVKEKIGKIIGLIRRERSDRVRQLSERYKED